MPGAIRHLLLGEIRAVGGLGLATEARGGDGIVQTAPNRSIGRRARMVAIPNFSLRPIPRRLVAATRGAWTASFSLDCSGCVFGLWTANIAAHFACAACDLGLLGESPVSPCLRTWTANSACAWTANSAHRLCVDSQLSPATAAAVDPAPRPCVLQHRGQPASANRTATEPWTANSACVDSQPTPANLRLRHPHRRPHPVPPPSERPALRGGLLRPVRPDPASPVRRRGTCGVTSMSSPQLSGPTRHIRPDGQPRWLRQCLDVPSQVTPAWSNFTSILPRGAWPPSARGERACARRPC